MMKYRLITKKGNPKIFATTGTLAMFAVSMAIEAASAATVISDSGLANPETVITFDEIVLPPGTPLTDQYAGLGVEFDPNLYYNPDPNVLNPPDPSIPGNNAIGNFVIEGTSLVIPPIVNTFSLEFTETLSQATFAAATAFPGSIELTALLDGEEIETFSSQTSGSIDPITQQLGSPAFTFYGFSEIALDQIQVSLSTLPNPIDGSQFDAIQLDNIQLGVAENTTQTPEPSSIISLFWLSGLCIKFLKRSAPLN
jgi:hypothetical protein